MKRAVLALATLAACSSPATGLRVGPTATTSTTSAQQSEGVGAPGSPLDTGDRRPAPSGPTVVTDVVTSVVTTAPPATTEPPTSLVVAPASTTVSWYGAESGARTANGDTYDPEGLTFAHRTLAFGSRVRFCRNGSCVVAVATDRGPAASTGRDFDLSEGTFAQLAPLSAGVATVTWEQLG